MISAVALASQLLLAAGAILPPDGAEVLRIKLPFQKDSVHVCGQGNHGKQTHDDAINAFAWDFDMPEGTPVLAAAAGRVLFTKEDSSVGGPDRALDSAANYVMIDHGGGRFSIYFHLQQHSLVVRPGQLVNGGQVIGLSGSTGYSFGPHLHFAVTDCGRRSVPSSFLDVEGDGVPVEGKTYRSGNDGTDESWCVEDSPTSLRALEVHGLAFTSSAPPWRMCADGVYEFAGQVTIPRCPLSLLVWAEGQAGAVEQIPIMCNAEGLFVFKLRPSDFKARLSRGEILSYGFVLVPKPGSPDIGGSLPLVVDPECNGERSIRVQLGLPVSASKPLHYVCENTHSALSGMTKTITLSMPTERKDHLDVVAAADGRVIEANEQPLLAGRSGLAKGTTTLTLDHGHGVLTSYFGLATKSLGVHAGEIVRGGTLLGSVPSTPKNARVVIACRTPSDEQVTALFTDMIDDKGSSEGDCEPHLASNSVHLFRKDSSLDAEALAGDGITSIDGCPLSTFNVNTTYPIRVRTTDGSPANFLIRNGKDRKTVASVQGARTEEGTTLSVRLGEIQTKLGTGPLEWCIAASSKAFASPPRWLPLTLMR